MSKSGWLSLENVSCKGQHAVGGIDIGQTILYKTDSFLDTWVYSPTPKRVPFRPNRIMGFYISFSAFIYSKKTALQEVALMFRKDRDLRKNINYLLTCVNH